jgi:hypothetical protein
MAYGAFREVNGTIAEREYCVANQISTTGVSSCMIVVAKVGSKLFGIHLSIFGVGDAFGPNEADEVAAIMNRQGADLHTVHLFGELEFWGGDVPGYDRLMTNLGHPSQNRQHQRAGNLTITSVDLA